MYQFYFKAGNKTFYGRKFRKKSRAVAFARRAEQTEKRMFGKSMGKIRIKKI